MGKAEHYMATAINAAGCTLALSGHGILAVFCWAYFQEKCLYKKEGCNG